MSLYIRDAMDFYSWNHFNNVNVPYIVDVDVSGITKPGFCYDLHHNKNKVYVASGEQSFIQLMKENKLKDGQSMCITPCYRDEIDLDETHYLMFLKLELIIYYKKWDDLNSFYKEMDEKLNYMISVAKKFFEEVTKIKFLKSDIQVIQINEDQYDIIINGIEVGSYGIRETPYGNFIYGTGLALPRFEQAIFKQGYLNE